MQKSAATSLFLKASLVGLGLLAASCRYAETVLAHYEEPVYEAVRKDGGIEIRAYSPRIVAEVELRGERAECLEQGFRILAGYIFGKNKPALVTREPVREKISMTAPVASEPGGDGRYLIRFFMPSRHSLESLPVPEDPRVKLRALPAQVFAVRRFSGRWTANNFGEQRRALLEGLSRMNLEAAGPVIDACYNPPFTVPFMRRNEVMVPVSEDAARRRI